MTNKKVAKACGMILHFIAYFAVVYFSITIFRAGGVSSLGWYFIWVAILYSLFAFSAFLLKFGFSDRLKHWMKRYILWIFFLIYIECLITVSFFSGRYYEGNFEVPFSVFVKAATNFIPFHFFVADNMSLASILRFGLENLLMLLPLGIFIPLLSRKFNKWYFVLSFSLLLSIAIQVLQLFLRLGNCDIDSIWLNCLGAMLGFYGFPIVSRYWRKLIA